MKKVPRFYATIFYDNIRPKLSPEFRNVDALYDYLKKEMNPFTVADITIFYPRRVPIVMLEDVLCNEIDRVKTLKHCEEVKI